jgi:RNA-directed DNA polymerase
MRNVKQACRKDTIERWLAAPVQLPDGSLMRPEKGVPQGAVLSPLLSNLFLH